MSHITSAAEQVTCRWCGMTHGGRCLQVKAIEYHPDGSVKRVEFTTWADFMPAQVPPPAIGLTWHPTLGGGGWTFTPGPTTKSGGFSS